MCRPPMGVPVTFAGVSTYADDGTAICGIFDRPVTNRLRDDNMGGTSVASPEVQLPYNAFSPMPRSGDTVTVDGTDYQVNAPEARFDGAFQGYELMRVA